MHTDLTRGHKWLLLASSGLLLMKEECRISSLSSPLICCRMQGKRTDHCKVRIEVFNLLLGEKSCIGRIELVKPVSIVHRSIPAWPRPPPPRLLRYICPAIQSRGWGICKNPGAGHLPTLGLFPRAVSYQNITTHKILLGKKRTDSSVKDRLGVRHVLDLLQVDLLASGASLF